MCVCLLFLPGCQEEAGEEDAGQEQGGNMTLWKKPCAGLRVKWEGCVDRRSVSYASGVQPFEDLYLLVTSSLMRRSSDQIGWPSNIYIYQKINSSCNPLKKGKKQQQQQQQQQQQHEQCGDVEGESSWLSWKVDLQWVTLRGRGRDSARAWL